jgi:hypothetical protein
MSFSVLRALVPSLTKSKILVVTHGAFLHFLTEDWNVDGKGGGDPLLSMCSMSDVQYMAD